MTRPGGEGCRQVNARPGVACDGSDGCSDGAPSVLWLALPCVIGVLAFCALFANVDRLVTWLAGWTAPTWCAAATLPALALTVLHDRGREARVTAAAVAASVADNDAKVITLARTVALGVLGQVARAQGHDASRPEVLALMANAVDHELLQLRPTRDRVAS